MVRSAWNVGLLALVLSVSTHVMAQEKAAEKVIEPVEAKLDRPVDFEKDVFPILDAKCVACHNVAIAENGLILEDVKSILKGGKRGPAVVAKDPAKSVLYTMSARSFAPVMPPLPNKVEASALTPQELGLLKKWIEEGASEGMGSGGKTIVWQPIPKGVHPIYATAVSADGQVVAAGRANGVAIYNVPAGDLAAQLTDPALLAIQHNGKPMYGPGAAHRDFVHSLAMSPNGKMLASGGYREVKLWARPDVSAKLNLAGSPGAVNVLAISPDDKWVATASTDNAIRIWNMADGQVAKTLAGHSGLVTAVAFTSDSLKLVSGSADQSVRVWDVAAGTQLAQMNTAAPITAVAVAVDASKLFTGHADKVIRVWPMPAAAAEATTPMPATEIKGSNTPIVGLAINPATPTHLWAASEEGLIRGIDTNNGQAFRSMNHGGPVTGLAIRADGARVASAGANSIAKLWDATNGQQVAEMKGDVRAVRVVQRLTADDGQAKAAVQVATAAVPAAEKVLTDRNEALKKATEAKTKAEQAATEATTKLTQATEAAANAKKAAEEKKDDAALQKAAADTEKARVDADAAAKKANEEKQRAVDGESQAKKDVDQATAAVNKSKGELEGATNNQKAIEAALTAAKQAETDRVKPIRSIAFSRDGKEVTFGCEAGYFSRCDGTSGVALDGTDAHSGSVAAMAYTAGKLLATAGSDGAAKVWDVTPQWQLVGVLGPKPEAPLDVQDSKFVDRVLSLAFNPAGTLLATGGGDPSRSGELMIWDVATKQPAKVIADAHSDTIFGMEFSRDGKFLLTGAADKFVKIFDVEAGKLVKSFEGHTNHVLDVAWRADGQRIVSAGADNAIKVWNVELGEQERTITGYQKQVTSIQYVGRANQIVSCGGDKTVRFHTADNGGNNRNFGGATDFLYSVSASENEQLIVAGGQDGVLRVWNAQNAQVVRTFDPPKEPDAAQAAK